MSQIKIKRHNICSLNLYSVHETFTLRFIANIIRKASRVKVYIQRRGKTGRSEKIENNCTH